MTTQPAKKMHDSARNSRPLLLFAWFVGVIEALLAARFTIQLFAARPDNPVLDRLLRLTAPLRAPLAFLDAGQPQYGAVLEYSTLVTMLLVLIVGYLAWIVLRTATVRRHRTS